MRFALVLVVSLSGCLTTSVDGDVKATQGVGVRYDCQVSSSLESWDVHACAAATIDYARRVEAACDAFLEETGACSAICVRDPLKICRIVEESFPPED